SLQFTYRMKCVGRPELARCGHYGDPPQFRIFARQLLDWQVLVIVQKLLLGGLVLNFRSTMAAFAEMLLGWLDEYPRSKLVVVMVITPLVLNVFALWTADSFLQADAEGEALQESEELVHGIPAIVGRLPESSQQDGEDPGEESVVSFQEWKRRSLSGPPRHSTIEMAFK
ncbi:unnamed protein product, partial [Polarella glacialis]